VTISRGGLTLLDVALHPIHVAIILLSTLGWIFPPTRKIGLAIQVLVLISWFGLGWFRGLGYCLATDWHDRIQKRLGRTGFPHGYIRFLCERLAGIEPGPARTDRITMSVFFVALACSLVTNLL
jgi:hypothetical protein